MRHQPLITCAPPPPLVAVAHGSRDPRAAATVEDLLDLVRRRSGLRVVTSYLDHAPPTPGQALGALAGAGTGAGEAVVLPLLLTAAYHSKTDIPGALTEVRREHPRMRLRYGATLGPHPLMTAALERRLAEAGVTPDPDTALVLAAAGSSDPSANATIGRMARGWRGWRRVVPAYASAARPTPAEAVRRLLDAGAPRVAVASYFLAPGHFADKVRDESLAAGAVAVSGALGAAPELAEIIEQRYTEIITLGDQAAVG
ncbi:sirohydrochlorin chelatase [Actinoallomurus iriomotensis]|uniref:Sirohydrochlorin chelatase n=1 Tax=Actinoallomurus iriomotensis TaxID=478107 RepID=A0A9W6VWA7_9ACTN|nr:sirohydrochlorin chelatase [Actinoallomurus iriomotensis]GLY81412.1 sirohydrochlorin chelatase [Actinoallomurus iriomotensis]